MYQNFTILALIIVSYALFAGKIEKGPISGPIVFLTFGLLLGPLAFHILNVKFNKEAYLIISEIALAIVLFHDASQTNLKILNYNKNFPIRLLLIGLPLSIIAGYFFGLAIFKNFNWVELALLSAALAPTDAALGEPVVTNKKVPSKIREALNVESGLNDGICVPIVLLLFALKSTTGDEDVNFAYGLRLFVEQIGIGVAVGIVMGWLGHFGVTFAIKKGWVEVAWKPVIIVMLAIATFSLAQATGGSGFIASFVGGLAFGRYYKQNKEELLESSSGYGKILSALVWIVFGSVITGYVFKHFTFEVLLYAIGSVTVIRIIPVLLVLMGTRINFYERLFIAWFGPRGLASIVFGSMILEEALPHGETVVVTICLTILLSVFAHGITATPMVNLFTRK